MKGAFVNGFLGTSLRIARGTALYHATGFIGDDGVASHTQTAGAKIVLPTASDAERAEFRAFLTSYPMIGTVALSTRRPVNATSRNGLATAMYHATQDIDVALALRSADSTPFLHLVAPAGNYRNDMFVAQMQELTDRMRDADEKHCLVVWDAYPTRGLDIIDGSDSVTLVFVQSVDSMKTSLLVPAKNLFSCPPGAAQPLLEIVYALLPQYMTNVMAASEI